MLASAGASGRSGAGRLRARGTEGFDVAVFANQFGVAVVDEVQDVSQLNKRGT